jgi:1,4-alpha-glucan branching enzyme
LGYVLKITHYLFLKTEFLFPQLFFIKMATKKVATPQIETAVATEKVTTKKATAKTTATTVTASKTTTNTDTTAKITFSLPKEAVGMAKTVALVGDFNNWDIVNGIVLKKQKDGSYVTTLELATGKEYQYRFLINGEIWENAWNAPKYTPSPFGGDNSVVFA